MKLINSKDNRIIKEIRKLKEKKYRDEENLYIVEGVKLVEEAIDNKMKIKKIVLSEDCLGYEVSEDFLQKIYNFCGERSNEIEKEEEKEIKEENKKEKIKKENKNGNEKEKEEKNLENKIDLILTNASIFSTISDVKTPQGVLAIIEKNTYNFKVIDFNQDLILALDGVQDPGNLGTILRTADSCGLNQIIISDDTADPYNPKVVRSTMGAIYRVKIIRVENLKETLQKIKEKDFQIMVTTLDSKDSIYNTSLDKKVLVMGNEANGVSKEVIDISDNKVIIPMLGKTESLNVSVATAVVLYERTRRKLE